MRTKDILNGLTRSKVNIRNQKDFEEEKSAWKFYRTRGDYDVYSLEAIIKALYFTKEQMAQCFDIVQRYHSEAGCWEYSNSPDTPLKGKEYVKFIFKHSPNRVPDMTDDKAATARKRGWRISEGMVYLRQDYKTVKGNRDNISGTVKFTEETNIPFYYALIEAKDLQPSHLNGRPNPLFFINEAQPKNRTDNISVLTAEKHAADIHPEEVLACPNAYSGAPVVNSFGEVIQGNGRAHTLRLLYSNKGKNADKQRTKYKVALSEFLDSLDKYKDHYIRKAFFLMDEPVLVRVVPNYGNNSILDIKIYDDKCIKLGQYTDTQLTTGGRQIFAPFNVARSIMSDGNMAQFTRILFDGSTDDDSRMMSEYLQANGPDVIQWLATKQYITPAEAQTCFNGRNISPEGREGIRGILNSILFIDAPDSLPECFENIPTKAQVAILASIERDFKMPEDKRLLPDIQGAIEVCYKLSTDENFKFAQARDFDKAWAAVNVWRNQYSMDYDGKMTLPAERYSTLSLILAACFKGMTQNQIKHTLSEMYDKMSGAGSSLFDEASDFGKQCTKAEAVKAVFDIDYSEGLGKVSPLRSYWHPKERYEYLKKYPAAFSELQYPEGKLQDFTFAFNLLTKIQRTESEKDYTTLKNAFARAASSVSTGYVEILALAKEHRFRRKEELTQK